MPNWYEENQTFDGKMVIKYSCFFTLIFNIVYAVTFGSILQFHSLFNFSPYITNDFSIFIKTSLFGFLICMSFNTLVIHSNMLLNYFNNYIKLKQYYSIFLSLFFSWVLSLVFANWDPFMSVLNWSSLIILGFVNFTLPFIIYIKAIKQSICFEENFSDSSKLDFEGFLISMNNEISLSVIDPKTQSELFFEINDIQKELKENNDVNDDKKNKIIEKCFEIEGNYSTKRSFREMTFGILNFNSNQIILFFYFILTMLAFFIMLTIFLAMYHYFINKTLVINIFLQIKNN